MTENGPNSLIALGANLDSAVGAPTETLAAAIAALVRNGQRLRAISRFYRTPCFPAGAGPDYVNAVVSLDQAAPPAELLALLHDIEASFGRARDARWAGRTLDLDLLAAGDLVLPDARTQTWWRNLAHGDQMRMAPDRLILPHPRLQDRGFVLVPLADVAPDWVHPLTGRSVARMLAARPPAEIAAIVPL